MVMPTQLTTTYHFTCSVVLCSTSCSSIHVFFVRIYTGFGEQMLCFDMCLAGSLQRNHEFLHVKSHGFHM